MTDKILKKIKKVKVLVMDVDGVLTNGKINLDHMGREIKVFDVKDGFAIAIFKRCGMKTAILSARSSPAVTARAADLKIDKVYQDAYPKDKTFEKLLKYFKVAENEICFVGDDIPDICVLKRVGFSVAVFNAPKEVKLQADYTTKNRGGDGAVREVIELILRTQRKWKKIVAKLS